MKSLLDKVRAVQNCEKALTVANEGVASQLSLWLDSERTGIRSLAGRAFDENESMLKPTELVTSTLSATSLLLKNKVKSTLRLLAVWSPVLRLTSLFM